MYAVVGCRDCQALWVVEGRPDTTSCPRCGSRRQFDALRRFAETDDAAEARRVRSALLARRQGHPAGEPDEDPFGTAGGQNGDQAQGSPDPNAGRTGSAPRAIVRRAVRDLEEPSRAAVVADATQRGVPATVAHEMLDRLVAAGEIREEEHALRLA